MVIMLASSTKHHDIMKQDCGEVLLDDVLTSMHCICAMLQTV